MRSGRFPTGCIPLLLGAIVLGLLGFGCATEGAVDHRASPEPAERSPAQPAISVEPAPSAAPSGPWREIGRSNRARPIECRNIGRGPLKVFLIAGIHGNEPEGLAGLDSIVVSLQAPQVARLATVCVVRDMNPDGSAARRRTNARGVDLNRNWPASNYRPGGERGSGALSEPETRAVHAAMLAFDPDLVVIFHSIAGGPFVNFDGPGADAAAAFASAASKIDHRWRVVRSMGYPTPGSIGTLSGIDRQVPTLTIEFKRGQSAESASRAAVAGLAAAIEASSLGR